MRARIQIDRETLADFCRRNHIRRLAFFGSVLRDDFGPDSDIDVLVEFETGHVPGLAFEAEIRDTLDGHLCRRTGYQGMVDAVLALVALRERG